MRQIDVDAPEPVELLIERAGAAVARAARDMLGGTYGRRVVVIAGKGNNGKDGIAAADRLRRRGVKIKIYSAEDLPEQITGVDLLIDAAYGTGFRAEFVAPTTDAQVLAVDIVSGVDGNTGVVSGRALKADRTLTFAALKPGLLLGAGAELSGEIEIADIGLDVSSANAGRVTVEDARGWLPRRGRNAHKWQSAVRVVAGSPGMSGAASLSCSAALRSGAGIVVASSIGAMAENLATEVVARELPQNRWVDQLLVDLGRFKSLLIGPGLGTNNVAQVAGLLDRITIPALVDADALFAVGDCSNLQDKQILATPHEGEFRAITGSTPSPDRFESVRSATQKLGVPVLLKGPTTLVSEKSGFVYAIDTGDQRLATAGTGDVLAGCIAALMAQGMAPQTAGALGAFVHGKVLDELPPIGVVASDIAARLGAVFAHLS